MASDNAYILELYSGNGTVAKIAHYILGCPYITIDYDDSIPVTVNHMCEDITKWNDKLTAEIASKYEGRRPIVFASPPCEEYSRMKTTGRERNLQYADTCVRKVKEIAYALNALVIIIENPRTGLLKKRRVVTEGGWIPYRYDVDYCQYGAAYQKQTCIWSSIKLEGFEARICPLSERCQGMWYDVETMRMKHAVPFDKIPYEKRISIPDQLVVCLVRAVIPALTNLINKNKSRRIKKQKTSDIVNYIESGYIGEDNKFWLKVRFRGADQSEYLTVDCLDGQIHDYHFKNKSAKSNTLRAYNVWKAEHTQ